MKTVGFLLTLFLTFQATIGAEVDSILVPIDHNDVSTTKIKVNYVFEEGFDPDKETLVVLSDALDGCFTNYFHQLDFLEKYNIVYFSGRSHSNEIARLVSYSGQMNWSNAYKWLNIDQQAKDLELFRKKFLGDGKIHLISYPSASGIALHYLGIFPDQVSKILIINPLLFDLQKNMNFRPFEITIGEASPGYIEEKWIKFAWYLGLEEPFYGGKRKKNELVDKIHQFNSWGFLIPDVSENQLQSIAVKVRLFEHSRNYLYDHDEAKTIPSVIQWMKNNSMEVWGAFDRQPFRFVGMHYDLLTRFSGKMMIVCSSQNLMINPKTFEGLAEFISNPTMLYIKDAHALQKLYAQSDWSQVLQSFFDNDVEGQIDTFEKLQSKGLIH